jgi:hypothetical protein
LDCKTRTIDDPEVKLSKIGPIGLTLLLGSYYSEFRFKASDYPICKIEVRDDSFFGFLEGEEEMFDPASASFTPMKDSDLRTDKKVFQMHCTYKGKEKILARPLIYLEMGIRVHAQEILPESEQKVIAKAAIKILRSNGL